VESACVGHGHFDKKPCRIAMVDYDGNTLFDVVVRVPNIKDALTEFTGLSKEQINRGWPLEFALQQLHSKLFDMQCRYKNGVTIVGQSPKNDIQWTHLVKHQHYNNVIDLAPLFRTDKIFYSLRKIAYCLLNRDMNKSYHDPTEDAKVSMQIFREYVCHPQKLNNAKEKLVQMREQRAFPDFRIVTKFPNCNSMFNPKLCWCGQPTARDVEDVDSFHRVHAQSRPILQMTQELYEKYRKVQRILYVTRSRHIAKMNEQQNKVEVPSDKDINSVWDKVSNITIGVNKNGQK